MTPYPRRGRLGGVMEMVSPMQPMNRVQGNIVNRQERRFLDWACQMMPGAVTSDHLTALGVFGAFLVLAGYAGTQIDPRFLWLSPIGFLVHWFGDSLDGSLARYRNLTRPRYGYFVDHSLDALCIFLMIGGMGLSPYVRMDVALFVVLGYYALCIHVFLKNHVTGTFQLSFMALGPTELRMAFIVITVWMAFGGHGPGHLSGVSLSDYDICLTVMGGVFFSLFMVNTAAMIASLRALEGNGRRLPTSALSESAGRPMARARVAEAGADQLRTASGPRAF